MDLLFLDQNGLDFTVGFTSKDEDFVTQFSELFFAHVSEKQFRELRYILPIQFLL